MSSDIEQLTFEVEKILGKQLIPVDIDKRMMYAIPISVFVLLLVFRPSYLYSKQTEDKPAEFKVYLLVWYTLFITAIIAGCIFAYKYRRFF